MRGPSPNSLSCRSMFLRKRPRRLRANRHIRDLVAETRLTKDMFVYPYFVKSGKRKRTSIDSMPGIYQWSADKLLSDVEKGLKVGVNKILLFGVDEPKSVNASSAYNTDSAVPAAIKDLRKAFGDDLYIITDVCLCAYTDHGHCGVLKNGKILNDPSLELLSLMSLVHAQAGADMVAPSDMMDGRVGAIRETLEKQGYHNTAIMSYAVKYASAYYGPFRDAANSSPKKGNRSTYQMDFRSTNEAIREVKLDEEEGADVVMVKPALAYLDIIREVNRTTDLPVACYNVSGEYSMVKNAAKQKLIDERGVVMENMYAFARAGSNFIISYHTRDIFEKSWL